MKTISMGELSVGDIFTHELKLHNRTAYEVIKVNDASVECINRTTSKPVKKQKKGKVIFLRKDGD